MRIGLGAHQEHRVNHEARAADRTKVSAEVIQLTAHEVEPEPLKAESEGGTSDSESVSDSVQNDPPSSLAADAEQYELMQTSYSAVGKDFHDQEDFIGSEYSKLQRLELVPERWPLARLSFSLQKCVDHLDRVVAGCCWEVQATRETPQNHSSPWLIMQEINPWHAHSVAMPAQVTHSAPLCFKLGHRQFGLCFSLFSLPDFLGLLVRLLWFLFSLCCCLLSLSLCRSAFSASFCN